MHSTETRMFYISAVWKLLFDFIVNNVTLRTVLIMELAAVGVFC